MSIISIILVLIVALEHIYIMLLEMFGASSKAAQRSFRLDPAFLADKRVKTLFANQGLYNGFLAAGLLFSLFVFPTEFRITAALFFVSCVVIAALYGAITSSKRILLMQGTPAILALISLLVL